MYIIPHTLHLHDISNISNEYASMPYAPSNSYLPALEQNFPAHPCIRLPRLSPPTQKISPKQISGPTTPRKRKFSSLVHGHRRRGAISSLSELPRTYPSFKKQRLRGEFCPQVADYFTKPVLSLSGITEHNYFQNTVSIIPATSETQTRKRKREQINESESYLKKTSEKNGLGIGVGSSKIVRVTPVHGSYICQGNTNTAMNFTKQDKARKKSWLKREYNRRRTQLLEARRQAMKELWSYPKMIEEPKREEHVEEKNEVVEIPRSQPMERDFGVDNGIACRKRDLMSPMPIPAPGSHTLSIDNITMMNLVAKALLREKKRQRKKSRYFGRYTPTLETICEEPPIDLEREIRCVRPAVTTPNVTIPPYQPHSSVIPTASIENAKVAGSHSQQSKKYPDVIITTTTSVRVEYTPPRSNAGTDYRTIPPPHTLAGNEKGGILREKLRGDTMIQEKKKDTQGTNLMHKLKEERREIVEKRHNSNRVSNVNVNTPKPNKLRSVRRELRPQEKNEELSVENQYKKYLTFGGHLFKDESSYEIPPSTCSLVKETETQGSLMNGLPTPPLTPPLMPIEKRPLPVLEELKIDGELLGGTRDRQSAIEIEVAEARICPAATEGVASWLERKKDSTDHRALGDSSAAQINRYGHPQSSSTANYTQWKKKPQEKGVSFVLDALFFDKN